jgi:hypothetical protein
MTKPPAPRTDSDTFEVLDEALSELADRRHAWLGDDIVVIGLLVSLIDQAERFLPQLVTTARANGHSWDDLAAMLRTSPHEARLRFDPDSPIADGRWPYDTD